MLPLADEWRIARAQLGRQADPVPWCWVLVLLSFPVRYSGSDIAVVVRDALMQPVRKVLSSTHFKRVPVKGADGSDVEKWTPCSPGDPAAEEKTWNDVSSDELLEPPLVVSPGGRFCPDEGRLG